MAKPEKEKVKKQETVEAKNVETKEEIVPCLIASELESIGLKLSSLEQGNREIDLAVKDAMYSVDKLKALDVFISEVRKGLKKRK